MNTYTNADTFAPARVQFEHVAHDLAANRGDLFACEQFVAARLIEIGRLLIQGTLDLMAARESPRDDVRDSSDRPLPYSRPSARTVVSLFGPVQVRRLAYSARSGDRYEHPMDEQLGLQRDSFSLNVRARVARVLLGSSYAEAKDPSLGVLPFPVCFRSMQRLTVRMAEDFAAFYAQRSSSSIAPSTHREHTLLILSTDGKGVPMRTEGLRPATQKAAEQQEPSAQRYAIKPGQKRQRKRMAQVAAVYSIDPFVRAPEDVLRELRPEDEPFERVRPRPQNKRVWASVERDAEVEIAAMFDEAALRDPERKQRWIVLVDGNEFQLEQVRLNAKRLKADVTIVVDLLHVSGYLWAAGSALHGASTVAAQLWTDTQVLRLLRGEAREVSRQLRRIATIRKLKGSKLDAVEAAARYLSNHAEWLKYDEALTDGLPIATGVIEGACRYVVKDRMERTGSRWSLAGAEAILQLRALWASGDWEAYVQFHCAREAERARRPRRDTREDRAA
jgi:hypothetical protein